MSNISDKDIDRLFRQAAEGYRSSFDEGRWRQMKERLSADTSPDGFGFYKTIGGIIGGVLLVIALLFLLPSGSGDNQQRAESVATEQADIVSDNALSNDKSASSTAIGKQETTQSQKILGETASESRINKTDKDKPVKVDETSTISHQSNSQQSHILDKDQKASNKPKAVFEKDQESQAFAPLLLLNKIGVNPLYKEFLLERKLEGVPVPEEPEEEDESFRKWLAAKVVFAPDLSSVGYFSPDRPGSNLGLIAEFGFAKRWSVSTGAMLSRKIYYSQDVEETYGSGSNPIDRMDGNCKMIDIPVNVSYYLTQNERHNFYLTTGLSSYLMLSEDYVFKSDDYYSSYTWEQSYGSGNNHFLGIVNFKVGYERNITNNIFLQIEPFLKAPVTGIGEGKVDLVSSGAFFNLKYQFKSR